MSVLISCPACGNQGDLPAGGLSGVVVTCRQCGVKFAPNPNPAPFSVAPAVVTDSELAVWVGEGPSRQTDVAPILPPVEEQIPLAVAVADPTPQPTGVEITAENAAGHLEWLRTETHRFGVYVDRQLAALGKMREQVAAFESKSRADAVVREQALSRERMALDSRAVNIARRETELAAALTQQGDVLAAELNELVSAERDNLARRAEELAKTERSLQLRLNEVEELEHTLRQELDEREVAVERQRRVLEDVAHELRTRTPAPVSVSKHTPPPTRLSVALACG
jgi:signal transduction histidine kinase